MKADATVKNHNLFKSYGNTRRDLKIFLVEKEKGEVILNEDYNNKQKERVRRDFKDKIHHHGMKKEDARESLRFGQILTRVHPSTLGSPSSSGSFLT